MTDVKKCDFCTGFYSPWSNEPNYNGHLRFEKLSGTKTVFDYDICPHCFDEVYETLEKALKPILPPEEVFDRIGEE